MMKKLRCILTFKHFKAFSIAAECGGTGYCTMICRFCDGRKIRKCPLEHCECCGKHCYNPLTILNPIPGNCQCSKCRIKRSLAPEFFVEFKISFLKIHNSFVRLYGKKLVDEVLSDERYDKIRGDIEKYTVLL